MTEDDRTFLAEVVGAQNLVLDASELAPLNEDWMRKYKGRSKIALKPTTTKQVATILRYCNEKRCVHSYN